MLGLDRITLYKLTGFVGFVHSFPPMSIKGQDFNYTYLTISSPSQIIVKDELQGLYKW